MSNQRARLRARREAAGHSARQQAEQRRAGDVSRRRRRTALAAGLRRTVGLSPRPVDSAMRRSRARRWAPVVAMLFVLNVVGWVLWTSVTGRVLVAVVTVALLPLIAIWVTDSDRRAPGRYGRRL